MVRHHAGHMNPQAHGEAAPHCPDIAGAPISDLVAEHGSPLYVFSEATLRQAYRDVHRAFQRRYPDVQLAWSYKTNYLKAICALFHQEGAIAEVVSDFEYEKARGLGVPGHEIIFNGPCKSVAALERAIDEGALIQIDNMDELATLNAIALRKRRKVDIGIRVFMDCGVQPVWSKFGFNADSDDAVQAMKRIYESGCLRLVGLHTHVGTFILEPEVYTRAVEKLVSLAEIARRQFGCEITYLNLGGGLPSRSELHYQYLPAEDVVPPLDDYAEAICRPLREGWPRDLKLPRLYLETGRALVDEAGYLVTTILANKQSSAPNRSRSSLSSARNKSGYRGSAAQAASGYLVDSGIHLLYTAAWYRFNVQPTRPVPGSLTERTIFGCLCMNIDVLRPSVPLPDMKVGDTLVFHPVGAYNITQSMQFITYRPRVVMVTEDGQVEIIRDRENLEHVEALERLPEGLQSRDEAIPCAPSRNGHTKLPAALAEVPA
jgi:diaminopimelate decarboxylase